MAAKTPVKAITVKIMVRTPGGRGLENALVKMSGSTLSDPISARADKQGVATIPIPESLFPEGSDEAEVQFVASKAHHGPLAAASTSFANGPVKTSAKVTKKGAFAEGTSNLDKFKRLQMVLVDGGGLGKLHSGTLTRRLSTEQIAEELLYHHARGSIRITGPNEMKCDHAISPDDPDGEKGESCMEYCGIDTPTQTESNRIAMDSVLHGVSTFQLAQFFDSGAEVPKFTYANKSSLPLLYRRHAVGLSRLYRLLRDEGYVAMYTVGLHGEDPASRNDCHGQGRAMDISGVAKEIPAGEKTKRSSPYIEQPVRLGKDFIVVFHWGMMKLRVEKTAKDGTVTIEAEDDKFYDYSTELKASSHGRLLYRLDPRPEATSRPPKMTLSDEHLDESRRIFKIIYDFVAKEYSYGDEHLGPIDPVKLGKARADALIAADNAPPPAIGSQSHLMLYPEYPSGTNADKPKYGRKPHLNHYHVQLGTTGTQDWKTLP